MPRDLPAALSAALDLAVLERQPDGLFSALGDPPAWLKSTLALRGDAFDVAATFDALGPFLGDARAVWAGEADTAASGTFTEADASGRTRPLYARAFRIGDREILTLGPPVHAYAQTQRLLQHAREDALAQQRTQRRIEEREILLHCIVHDLSNPLQNLRSSLQLLDDGLEPEESREMIELASRQTDRMQDMIREVLSLFRDEVETLMPLAAGASADLAAVSRQLVAALAPRADDAGVGLVLDVPDAPLAVVGEAQRLARAVDNLLDNALRHSPPGGSIRVSVTASDAAAELAVEDDGPGVPPDEVGELFTRLRQGRATGGTTPGQAGLGLYFCRIAAENGGGRVGYAPSPSGGARFWVRLPLAPG